MHTKKARRIALVLTIGAIVAAAVPAVSASRPGRIKHTSLTAGQAISGVVPIEWNWKSGTKVNSADTVNIFISTDGANWTRIAKRVPIRNGRFDWNTDPENGAYPDFAYAVQLKVFKKPVRDIVSPVYVDNKAPMVAIIEPSDRQVIVDKLSPEYAVVAGQARLRALAFDGFTGVAEIGWYLDDAEEPFATEADFVHDFNDTIGPHTLTFKATDFAGNSNSDSIEILALPFPSGLSEGEAPELPDTGEEPTLPDPGDEQELPELPDPGDEQELPELPDPDEEPTLPDPDSDLPALPGGTPDDIGELPDVTPSP